MKSALDRAQDLLGKEPLPDDAESRLDALYEAATDEEKALFPMLYEALEVAQTSEPTGSEAP